jgi:hypothetical protein
VQTSLVQTSIEQQLLVMVQLCPSTRHMVDGGGEQTAGPPAAGGRHSLVQHSEFTLHPAPVCRHALAAQYAEMFRDCADCPGNQ